MRQALLIIDVQQQLCEGPDAAFDHVAIIARINAASRQARASAVPVIFIQHSGKNGYLNHGSAGWQLADGLESSGGDLFVDKTTPDSFHNTDLQDLLNELQISDLVICGMHSEFCVDTTTRRAMALGYPVQLIADAHTSAGNAGLSAAQVIAHHNATLSNISSFGPRTTLISSDALRFAAPSPPSP